MYLTTDKCGYHLVIMDDPVEKAEAKNKYGNNFFLQKHYQSAILAYTEAIKICPQIAKYYGNRAACYILLNEYIKALPDARKSIELDKGFKKGYMRIAKCYLAFGNLKYAEDILIKARGIFHGDRDIVDMLDSVTRIQENINQFSIKMDNKKYDEALNCIEICIQKAPACSKYILNKSRCLICLQKFDEAEKIADYILKYNSIDEDALYVKATVEIHREDVEIAFKLSKELKQKLPDHSGATTLFRSASLLRKNSFNIENAIKEENYALAYELLSKSGKDANKNKQIYKQKIEIAGKDEKLLWNGVEDCTNYMRFFGEDKEILKTRAQFNFRLQEYEDAVKDYKKLVLKENSQDIREKLKNSEKNLKDQLKSDYKILKINKNATKDEIISACRELMRHYHPDKHPEATSERKKQLEIKLIRARKAQEQLLSNTKS